MYLPKFKSNVYLFLQGLSCGVLSVPDKNPIPNRHVYDQNFFWGEGEVDGEGVAVKGA